MSTHPPGHTLPPPTLWKHADFLRLWAGQTVSLFGSRITILALPVAAVVVLHASPAQMGFLAGLQAAPPLILGLVVGAWVDRTRRRPIMIAADIGRALMLAAIPISAMLGVLLSEGGLAKLLYDVGTESRQGSTVPPRGPVRCRPGSRRGRAHPRRPS